MQKYKKSRTGQIINISGFDRFYAPLLDARIREKQILYHKHTFAYQPHLEVLEVGTLQGHTFLQFDIKHQG